MSHNTLNQRLTVAALAILALAAVPAGNTNIPKTGAFNLHITERSKVSAIPTIVARMGWGTMEQVKVAAKKDGADADYNLSGETFEAFVPDDYSGSEPYGLLVWICPGPNGNPPQHWLDVLRKHKLIWVGANNSGNNRSKWVRLGLAIDAAEHMQREYKIDPLRVYVSGASGGGRCASMLAVGFPDVFTGGGYPLIGCDYFKIVELPPAPDGRPRYYKRHYERPAAKLLNLATKERRHVLLTGDKDANREQTEAYFNAMKKDGFKYVTYIQVPGMGHQSPDAEWFEKGIVALDESREAVAKVQQEAREKAVTAASAGAPRAPATPPIEAKASAEEEADKLMRLARLYVSNRMYSKAREKLNLIVKDHPSSAPAAEAKKLLKEIGTK